MRGLFPNLSTNFLEIEKCSPTWRTRHVFLQHSLTVRNHFDKIYKTSNRCFLYGWLWRIFFYVIGRVLWLFHYNSPEVAMLMLFNKKVHHNVQFLCCAFCNPEASWKMCPSGTQIPGQQLQEVHHHQDHRLGEHQHSPQHQWQDHLCSWLDQNKHKKTRSQQFRREKIGMMTITCQWF